MEIDPDKETTAPCTIGDRSTSDVIVRIRTQEGRDDWFYCHSQILIEKCKYFADRLSENWPTCQILDSRNCVEVYCQESEFNHHVTALRLLYVVMDDIVPDTWNGVRNALGILQVGIKLGCQQMVRACVDYIEAVPWEEAEEEEILTIIPTLGSEAEPILARLQPVDPTATRGIFLSTLHFATSSPPQVMNELKSSAQEQLEYMLTEDDDPPLLIADDELKLEVKKCINNLLTKFYGLLDNLDLILDIDDTQELQFVISDLSWACQILSKMEIMREFVYSWVEKSEKIVKTVMGAKSNNFDRLLIMVKVIEVGAKVLEAIAYGTVILLTEKRLHMVKLWLQFVRATKPLINSSSADEDSPLKMDNEIWQSLESALVSMVLALPSGDQAAILTEWLGTEHIQYPDLTEAFEVWCYRSKVAKRRLTILEDMRSVTN
ncbi:hypothetical protein BVC80_1289g76 [Macleaya cordata]|uniref:BTB/POZ-like n=1 Tax=Macleaya cordata TaxID=56857 RepID=A0A200Q9M3_MACCD|nr:hypothetical protein BVC80_1289g76 [Macleaya cordata]